jgi:hypothetical protein
MPPDRGQIRWVCPPWQRREHAQTAPERCPAARARALLGLPRPRPPLALDSTRLGGQAVDAANGELEIGGRRSNAADAGGHVRASLGFFRPMF